MTHIETNSNKFLIISDDKSQTDSLKQIIQGLGYEVMACQSTEHISIQITDADAQIALILPPFKHVNEIELVGKLKRIKPDLDCILISPKSDVQHAVEAFRQGVRDSRSRLSGRWMDFTSPGHR